MRDLSGDYVDYKLGRKNKYVKGEKEVKMQKEWT
jgi:hypothetical protein